MTEEWYSYGMFRFTREQVAWILSYKDYIRETGDWPPMPDEFMTDAFVKEGKKRGEWIKVLRKKSTFIDAPITKRQIMNRAYFANPMTILAEIGTRLLKTGKDGRDLYRQIKNGVEDYEMLVEDAQDALDYISGWVRRSQIYREWKRQRNYRRSK